MPDLATLAQRYGTPAYVYDLTALTRAVGDLRAALPEGVGIYYSLKANPHPGLVAALLAQGCPPEVTSPGELDSALTAGAVPGDCFYGGPGKSPQALRYALDRGVRSFSVESATDLHRLGGAATGAGVTVECLLRVNGSSAAGGSGLRMSGAASQFGVDLAQVPQVVAAARETPGVRLRGAHFYPVTNAATQEALLAELTGSIRTAAWLREQGMPLAVLDLGGGFASPYARSGERVVYQGLRAALTRELDAHLPGWREGSPQVLAESGRYLVGDSGTLLTRVLDVKESHGRRYAVLDSGVNHLGGLSGLRRLLPLSAHPEIVPTDLPSEAGGAAGAEAGGAAGADAPVDLAGPLCTPADLLGKGVELPGLRVGDLLAIPNVGAYGLSASLVGFLSHPAPVELLVQGDRVVSATRVALRREELPPR